VRGLAPPSFLESMFPLLPRRSRTPRLLPAALLLAGVALGAALPADARAQAAATASGEPVDPAGAPAAAEPMEVRPGWGDAFLSPQDPLVLELSRPLGPADGRLVLVVGGVDVSGLARLTSEALTYVPSLAGLPRGEVEVEVYRVEGEAGGWEALGRFPLQVRRAPGVDQVEWAPGMTLGNQGRLAAMRDPDPGPGPRDTYQDLTGNLNLNGALLRGDARVSGDATIVGVSHRNDALRFGEMQEEAPRVDLSSYRVGFEEASRGLRLQLGQVRQGSHPDLLRGHQARGLQAEGRLPGGVEVATALMHGSNRVGWSELTGLGERDHRILASQAGVDLLSARPGRLALEATLVDGSRLPRAGFQRAEVVEPETGRGYGLRMEGATPGLLQGVGLPRAMQGSVRGTVRWGRVDPFYRALGTFVRGDILERVADVQADAGPLSLSLTLDRSRDNLDQIPSILTTRTNRQSLRVGLPLGRLPGPGGAAVDRSALLPAIVYQHNQTHQFGANVPVDGGFDPSHIPDQMNDVHNLSLEWDRRPLRLGVRGGYTFQDNRQPGREANDFRNTTLGAALGFSPGGRTELSMEAAREVADNLGRDRTEVTLRGSVSGRLGLWQDAGLRASWSPSRTEAVGEDLLRTRGSAQVEFSQRLRTDRGPRGPLSGQLFVRFAHQATGTTDRDLGVEDRRREWNLASGLSLTLF
jgi:hypothetical protein